MAATLTPIRLSRTQEGALRHMAGQVAPNSVWGKPTVQTYKKLCALRLLEQSDSFPYHRATDDGFDWIVAADGSVDVLLDHMNEAQLRVKMAWVQAEGAPGRWGWNHRRAAAVVRELDRRYA